MKKAFMTCMMAFGFHLFAMADEATQLTVWMKDGTKVAFALSEKPEVTFSETELIITTKENNHYALESIAKFTCDVIDTDRITDLQTDATGFSLNGESLLLVTPKANTTVSVHTLGGMLVFSKTVENPGEYSFPLSRLNAGAYMVTVNGITYKIVKK